MNILCFVLGFVSGIVFVVVGAILIERKIEKQEQKFYEGNY